MVSRKVSRGDNVSTRQHTPQVVKYLLEDILHSTSGQEGILKAITPEPL